MTKDSTNGRNDPRSASCRAICFGKNLFRDELSNTMTETSPRMLTHFFTTIISPPPWPNSISRVPLTGRQNFTVIVGMIII
ncbi:unnamed protein product [Caenorhabditis nigoni]